MRSLLAAGFALALLATPPAQAQAMPAELAEQGVKSEAVVRALLDAGNRGDVEAWLALFHPDAHQFRRSEDPHKLADRPVTSVTDAASRRAFYVKAFADPVKVKAQIHSLTALGDLVTSRGTFAFPDRILHTLTVYRVQDGQILDIWDVKQVVEPLAAKPGD